MGGPRTAAAHGPVRAPRRERWSHDPERLKRGHRLALGVRRRRLLLATAGVFGAAGCLSAPTADDRPDGEAAPSPRAGTPAGPAPLDADVDLPVPRSELVRGAERDAIRAVIDPAFGPDWRDRERSLDDEDLVIGVTRDGAARAYPLPVVRVHEVVNDEFGGPLLVTYCPLCSSAVTAERTVDGEPTTFGVSGLLYNADLVMYDRATDSLWSQILARAIRGPETGTRLTLVPSTLTTWGAWRSDYPDTRVLLPPPASTTVEPPPDYGSGPVGHGQHGRVGVGVPSEYRESDDRLPATTLVVGVAHDGVARAYPFDRVRSTGVINDRVGGLPVVVAAGPTPHAYDRRVDGEVLTFAPAADGRMRAGGSTWSVATGRALDGPHEGRRLRPATGVSSLFWFAWSEFNPDTEVYGEDG